MGFTDIKWGLYFFLEFPRENLSLAFSSLLRLPTSLGSCPFFHHQRLPALCLSDPALRHISLSTQPRKFLHLQGFMDWASQVAHWWGWWGGFTCRVGDTRDVSSIPGLGSTPEEGNGNPLQYSCLRNSMDRGAWWAAVWWACERVGHDWATEYTHTWIRWSPPN